MAECVFCGDIAGTAIKVPYGYLPAVGDRYHDSDVLVDLPSCVECSEILSEVSFGSIEGASRYLSSVYRETYHHWLGDMLWTSQELRELGYNLSSTIEQSYRVQLEVKARVDHCENVGILGPAIPDEILDDINYALSLLGAGPGRSPK
ncbi:hypothetical protein [Mesorhizobium sp. WSM2239]|uniref:HNH endonuclease n=2 Tax=unclassified Mesorhizobium TaxID=325217 RepID=A0AAU8DHD2_9HYPH